MKELWIKLDTVAQLRQSSGRRTPDPAVVGALAELAGADGITIHLHAERSAVTERDIRVLSETLEGPLNVELSAKENPMERLGELRPQRVTLVAEPVDFAADRAPVQPDLLERSLQEHVPPLKDAGIEAWVYLSPSFESVKIAHRLGVQGVEFDSALFNYAENNNERETALDDLAAACTLAHKLGMASKLGGAVNTRNATRLAALPCDGLTVGQALIARALLVGVERAVKELHAQINGGLA